MQRRKTTKTNNNSSLALGAPGRALAGLGGLPLRRPSADGRGSPRPHIHIYIYIYIERERDRYQI